MSIQTSTLATSMVSTKIKANQITPYPFLVGFWSLTTDGNNGGTFLSISNTTTTNNFLALASGGWDANNWTPALAAVDSGGSTTATSATLLPANEWVYILGSFLSATSRRMDIFYSGGVVTISSSVSRTPTGLTTVTFGGRQTTLYSQAVTACIADVWWADINAIGELSVPTMESFARQLMRGGPFSIPALVPGIVEYHSLRDFGGSGCGIEGGKRSGEHYYRSTDVVSGSTPGWDNHNNAIAGPNPPVSYRRSAIIPV